jgi:hypothetical protein
MGYKEKERQTRKDVGVYKGRALGMPLEQEDAVVEAVLGGLGQREDKDEAVWNVNI